MIHEGLTIEDPDRRTAAIRFALSSESDASIKAMISMARSEPAVIVRRNAFDQNKLLLNVKNGMLELDADCAHQHLFREHRREDMITRIANANYDPDAKAPLWFQFLDDLTSNNPELSRYLQQLAGVSLTGLTDDHLFIICYGDGQTGRTTFLETLAYTVGDYAHMVDPNTLIAMKSDRVRNDVAALHGPRFVHANETEQGQRLAEALIKALTGGDTISARFLYQEFFQFKPQAKFWLRTNYKPVIAGRDNGIWRRIHLVPFDNEIPDSRKDNKLPRKLQAEASGILNWMLDGLCDYLMNGIHMPHVVADATAKYRQEQDVLQHFLDDCCEVSPNARVGKAELYRIYKTWANKRGHFIKNEIQFIDDMKRCGFGEIRNSTGKFWIGVTLKLEGEKRTSHADVSQEIQFSEDEGDGYVEETL